MKKEKNKLHEGYIKSHFFPCENWYKPKIEKISNCWAITITNKGRERKLIN